MGEELIRKHRRHLEESIRETLDLIKGYEDKRRASHNLMELREYDGQIAKLGEELQRYQSEWDNVSFGWVQLDVPQYAIDQVVRSSLLSQLQERVSSNSVVVVKGLLGSGKSHLVSAYLNQELPHVVADAKLWHSTQRDETLDQFLALIEARVNLGTSSNVSRCRTLMRYLREAHALLVIDDFHQVDQASYADLVSVALQFG